MSNMSATPPDDRPPTTPPGPSLAPPRLTPTVPLPVPSATPAAPLAPPRLAPVAPIIHGAPAVAPLAPSDQPTLRDTAAARFQSLGALLAPVDASDATWARVIRRMSDPRAPLVWLAGIGGVALVGYLFLAGQGDALDFYPALGALRRVLGAAVLLVLLALAAIGWLALRLRMAAARHHEAANALFLRAQTAPPAERGPLLDGALADWRAALAVCPRNLGPGAWATTQLCLARAAAQRAKLDVPGAANTAPGGDPLLDEAVTGYHIALQARASRPLMPGGTGGSGGPGGATAASAVSADWIAAQRELAGALRAQADRAPTSERAQRYVAAAAPYRAILAATPYAASPRAWADTQIAIANTLTTAAGWAAPPDATPLLVQAAAAYRAATEVYARHATEREWAALQRTLGDTLVRAAALAGSGDRGLDRGPEGPAYGVHGPEGLESGRMGERARLLDDALAAYRAAGSVLTRWTGLGDWAALQLASGEALRARAALEPDGPARDGMAGREGMLRAAVAALDGTLTVYTPEEQPREWAACQLALGETLCDLAPLCAPGERTQLVGEAVAALEAAGRMSVASGDTARAEHARAALDRARIGR